MRFGEKSERTVNEGIGRITWKGWEMWEEAMKGCRYGRVRRPIFKLTPLSRLLNTRLAPISPYLFPSMLVRHFRHLWKSGVCKSPHFNWNSAFDYSVACAVRRDWLSPSRSGGRRFGVGKIYQARPGRSKNANYRRPSSTLRTSSKTLRSVSISGMKVAIRKGRRDPAPFPFADWPHTCLSDVS